MPACRVAPWTLQPRAKAARTAARFLGVRIVRLPLMAGHPTPLASGAARRTCGSCNGYSRAYWSGGLCRPTARLRGLGRAAASLWRPVPRTACSGLWRPTDWAPRDALVRPPGRFVAVRRHADQAPRAPGARIGVERVGGVQADGADELDPAGVGLGVTHGEGVLWGFGGMWGSFSLSGRKILIFFIFARIVFSRMRLRAGEG
jgi:hypothetical protein